MLIYFKKSKISYKNSIIFYAVLKINTLLSPD